MFFKSYNYRSNVKLKQLYIFGNEFWESILHFLTKFGNCVSFQNFLSYKNPFLSPPGHVTPYLNIREQSLFHKLFYNKPLLVNEWICRTDMLNFERETWGENFDICGLFLLSVLQRSIYLSFSLLKDIKLAFE